ncbi:ParB/RepB/Spo0J family partition protein [Nocardioides albidus]|uniref:ParB/RepB/Spo0J family partition protein n=1 Tax=Nocardioides albidus TaxID=1517589 RepID=A0A5C4VRH3_9ACTN|nr:ParB/RepB/Spo0J family partition protein [Nocardioides albidus]TNM38430.1 ParB/RepB/Spo0J family partition protein [Nocardioides albidus]
MTANPPRRGLGRGLGSLIPTAPPPPADAGRPDPVNGGVVNHGVQNPDFGAGDNSSASADPRSTDPANGAQSADSALRPVDGAYFAELPVEQIAPNAVNPRTVFDEEAMAELVHSIKEIGLLQPVVVRRTGPEAYELVMGERRWRATQQAGLATIPAIVRETDDTDMLRDALLENLHRSNLNPLEEAAAYQQLLEDFSCTHDELAQRIGRSRPQISNTLRLLRLSPAVQRRVAAGVLSAGHARALLGVGDADQQDRLAQRVVAEGISVRGLEEIVAVGDGTGAAPARPRRAKPQAPGLGELSERLGDRLETRVKIDLGKAKGKISIEFANTGDLQRIVDLIDPRNRDDRPI